MAAGASVQTAAAGGFRVAVGTKVYVPCPKAVWATAEVLAVDADGLISAKLDDGDSVVQLKKDEPFYLCNTDEWNVRGLCAPDNLTSLTHLHEAAVLDSLFIRFELDLIYTFTGPILIAVNPFKPIKGLYDMQAMKRYITEGEAEDALLAEKSAKKADTASPREAASSPAAQRGRTRKSSEPHVFATSAAAYRGLCSALKSQTILISGESGAGKTESTKFVMSYLACAGSDSVDERSMVERQVLESNPLLEAFGNARTLRNDNSSRFGKFIELQFEIIPARGGCAKRARLCGACIKTYLLEKVRVCQQQEGERNYHIFYQLCAAAAKAKASSTAGGKVALPPRGRVSSRGNSAAAGSDEADSDDEDGELSLSAFEGREQYKLLTCSSCFRLQGVDDCAEFDKTLAAFRTLGISTRRLRCILAVVGSVLWLGNATFEASAGDAEASQPTASSQPSIARAGELLGVSAEALTTAMCFRTIRANKETYRKPLRPSEACEMRSALCRALYGRLFLRVVEMANEAIASQRSTAEAAGGASGGEGLFCGVLDIFGFECFGVNSFEQLCINYSNERLQQFFNLFVFSLEQELYSQEGIPWDSLSFPCNDECVRLLEEKPFGVFSLLDEECAVPGGKARGFCTKLSQRQQTHPCFATVKTRQQEAFVIRHFAGAVQYDTEGFLEKNKDQLSNDLVECLVRSTDAFVKGLFEADAAAAAAEGEKKTPPTANAASSTSSIFRRRGVTVSGEFRQQLGELMRVIASTTPHFIRCVRPNPSNVPDVFDRPSVNEQLRYGGVLQAVQVSRAGYPVRVPHVEAFKDYKALASQTLQQKQRAELLRCREQRSDPDWQSLARELLEDIDARLPLRVEKRRSPSQRGETETETQNRGWAVGVSLCFFKKETFELLSAHLTALKTISATKVQAQYKAFSQRRSFLACRAAAVVVQSYVRAWIARRVLRRLREEKSARVIQAYWRMALCAKKYKRKRNAVLVLQRLWKRKLRRRATAEMHSHLAAARIQAAWKMSKGRRAFLAVKGAARRIQLWWRRQLPRQLLRRLRAEAQSTSALVELVASLRADLKEAKQKVQEEALRSDHLQATTEELQRQLAKLKSENQTLLKKLEVAEARAAKRGSQLRRAKSVLRSQTQTPAAAASASSSRSNAACTSSGKALPQTPSLSSGDSSDDSRAEGTSLLSLLQKSATLTAEREREALRETSDLREKLQEAQRRLNEEVSQRERAEAKCRLLLQDAAGAPGGSDLSCGSGRPSPPPLGSLQPSDAASRAPDSSFSAAGKSWQSTSAASLEGGEVAAPPEPEFYDNRFIDLLLVSPPGVRVHHLLREFIISVGDTAGLELLKNQEEEEAGGEREEEQLLKIRLGSENGVAVDPAAAAPLHLTLLNLKFNDETRSLNVSRRAKQALVAAAVFDPSVPDSLQKAVAIATDLLVPAVREVAKVAPELQLSKVYVVECLDTREGQSGRSADFNTEHVIDFVAGMGCHYKALSSLSALVKDIFPFLCAMHEPRRQLLLRSSRSADSAAALSPLARKGSGVQKPSTERFDRRASHTQASLPFAAASRGSGAVWDSFSSKYFSTIRSFLSFPSREGSSGGSHSHKKASAAGPLLLPSAVAAPGVKTPQELQVVPVAEFASSPEGHAITYVVFGALSPSREFIYLAVGRRDGFVGVYKCFRTPLELAMLETQPGTNASLQLQRPDSQAGSSSPLPSLRRASELVQEADRVEALWGQKVHKRAVTSLMYTLNEEYLVSTSIDCTTRMWRASTGELMIVFTDRTASLCVAAMPFNSNTFVISSASACLRVFCTRSGKVLQKMRLGGEGRGLCFDDTGLYCFIGTKFGEIIVLETTEAMLLSLKGRFPIGKAAITCVVFVSSRSPRESPVLLVNSADNTIAVIECVFGQPPGALTNLQVIQRLKTSHSKLPLRCCYVPNGAGWVVSGSEDCAIFCHGIQHADKSRAARSTQHNLLLKYHQQPVLVVAVNALGTLLASGDSEGNIVFWRQLAPAEAKPSSPVGTSALP